MHSEGINAGEMKHGPLALVDDKLPIVVVSTMDSMHSKMAGVIQQVRAGSRWVGSAGGPGSPRSAGACCWRRLGLVALGGCLLTHGPLRALSCSSWRATAA